MWLSLVLAWDPTPDSKGSRPQDRLCVHLLAPDFWGLTFFTSSALEVGVRGKAAHTSLTWLLFYINTEVEEP